MVLSSSTMVAIPARGSTISGTGTSSTRHAISRSHDPTDATHHALAALSGLPLAHGARQLHTAQDGGNLGNSINPKVREEVDMTRPTSRAPPDSRQRPRNHGGTAPAAARHFAADAGRHARQRAAPWLCRSLRAAAPDRKASGTADTLRRLRRSPARGRITLSDIEAYEDEQPVWNAPQGFPSLLPTLTPPALALAQSFARLRLFYLNL
jgi:hypothetical protein